jgi:hypothetical protein
MTLDHLHDRDSSADDNVVPTLNPLRGTGLASRVSRSATIADPPANAINAKLAGAQANSDDVGPFTRRVLGRSPEAEALLGAGGSTSELRFHDRCHVAGDA